MSRTVSCPVDVEEYNDLARELEEACTELERSREELEHLREKARIRVKATELPENSLGTWVLAWSAGDEVPTVMVSAFVRSDSQYTHWMPLPPRPKT